MIPPTILLAIVIIATTIVKEYLDLKDDEVFKALSKKYGNPYDVAIINNAVFWVIDYEFTKKMHHKRIKVIEAEFGE
jgi:hypothetical protein